MGRTNPDPTGTSPKPPPSYGPPGNTGAPYTELSFNTAPITALANSFQNLANACSTAGSQVAGALASTDWLGDTADAAWQALTTIEFTMLVPAVSACTEIASVLNTYVQDIKNFQHQLNKEIDDELIAGLVSAILGGASVVGGVLLPGLLAGLIPEEGIIASIVASMSSALDAVGGALTPIIGTAGLNFVGGALVGAAVSVGQDLLTQGIIDGITGQAFKITPAEIGLDLGLGIVFGGGAGLGDPAHAGDAPPVPDIKTPNVEAPDVSDAAAAVPPPPSLTVDSSIDNVVANDIAVMPLTADAVNLSGTGDHIDLGGPGVVPNPPVVSRDVVTDETALPPPAATPNPPVTSRGTVTDEGVPPPPAQAPNPPLNSRAAVTGEELPPPSAGANAQPSSHGTVPDEGVALPSANPSLGSRSTLTDDNTALPSAGTNPNPPATRGGLVTEDGQVLPGTPVPAAPHAGDAQPGDEGMATPLAGPGDPKVTQGPVTDGPDGLPDRLSASTSDSAAQQPLPTSYSSAHGTEASTESGPGSNASPDAAPDGRVGPNPPASAVSHFAENDLGMTPEAAKAWTQRFLSLDRPDRLDLGYDAIDARAAQLAAEGKPADVTGLDAKLSSLILSRQDMSGSSAAGHGGADTGPRQAPPEQDQPPGPRDQADLPPQVRQRNLAAYSEQYLKVPPEDAMAWAGKYTSSSRPDQIRMVDEALDAKAAQDARLAEDASNAALQAKFADIQAKMPKDDPGQNLPPQARQQNLATYAEHDLGMDAETAKAWAKEYSGSGRADQFDMATKAVDARDDQLAAQAKAVTAAARAKAADAAQARADAAKAKADDLLPGEPGGPKLAPEVRQQNLATYAEHELGMPAGKAGKWAETYLSAGRRAQVRMAKDAFAAKAALDAKLAEDASIAALQAKFADLQARMPAPYRLPGEGGGPELSPEVRQDNLAAYAEHDLGMDTATAKSWADEYSGASRSVQQDMAKEAFAAKAAQNARLAEDASTATLDAKLRQSVIGSDLTPPEHPPVGGSTGTSRPPDSFSGAGKDAPGPGPGGRDGGQGDDTGPRSQLQPQRLPPQPRDYPKYADPEERPPPEVRRLLAQLNAEHDINAILKKSLAQDDPAAQADLTADAPHEPGGLSDTGPYRLGGDGDLAASQARVLSRELPFHPPPRAEDGGEPGSPDGKPGYDPASSGSARPAVRQPGRTAPGQPGDGSQLIGWSYKDGKAIPHYADSPARPEEEFQLNQNSGGGSQSHDPRLDQPGGTGTRPRGGGSKTMTLTSHSQEESGDESAAQASLNADKDATVPDSTVTTEHAVTEAIETESRTPDATTTADQPAGPATATNTATATDAEAASGTAKVTKHPDEAPEVPAAPAEQPLVPFSGDGQAIGAKPRTHPETTRRDLSQPARSPESSANKVIGASDGDQAPNTAQDVPVASRPTPQQRADAALAKRYAADEAQANRAAEQAARLAETRAAEKAELAALRQRVQRIEHSLAKGKVSGSREAALRQRLEQLNARIAWLSPADAAALDAALAARRAEETAAELAELTATRDLILRQIATTEPPAGAGSSADAADRSVRLAELQAELAEVERKIRALSARTELEHSWQAQVAAVRQMYPAETEPRRPGMTYSQARALIRNNEQAALSQAERALMGPRATRSHINLSRELAWRSVLRDLGISDAGIAALGAGPVALGGPPSPAAADPAAVAATAPLLAGPPPIQLESSLLEEPETAQTDADAAGDSPQDAQREQEWQSLVTQAREQYPSRYGALRSKVTYKQAVARVERAQADAIAQAQQSGLLPSATLALVSQMRKQAWDGVLADLGVSEEGIAAVRAADPGTLLSAPPPSKFLTETRQADEEMEQLWHLIVTAGRKENPGPGKPRQPDMTYKQARERIERVEEAAYQGARQSLLEPEIAFANARRTVDREWQAVFADLGIAPEPVGKGGKPGNGSGTASTPSPATWPPVTPPPVTTPSPVASALTPPADIPPGVVWLRGPADSGLYSQVPAAVPRATGWVTLVAHSNGTFVLDGETGLDAEAVARRLGLYVARPGADGTMPPRPEDPVGVMMLICDLSADGTPGDRPGGEPDSPAAALHAVTGGAHQIVSGSGLGMLLPDGRVIAGSWQAGLGGQLIPVPSGDWFAWQNGTAQSLGTPFLDEAMASLGVQLQPGGPPPAQPVSFSYGLSPQQGEALISGGYNIAADALASAGEPDSFYQSLIAVAGPLLTGLLGREPTPGLIRERVVSVLRADLDSQAPRYASLLADQNAEEVLTALADPGRWDRVAASIVPHVAADMIGAELQIMGAEGELWPAGTPGVAQAQGDVPLVLVRIAGAGFAPAVRPEPGPSQRPATIATGQPGTLWLLPMTDAGRAGITQEAKRAPLPPGAGDPNAVGRVAEMVHLSALAQTEAQVNTAMLAVRGDIQLVEEGIQTGPGQESPLSPSEAGNLADALQRLTVRQRVADLLAPERLAARVAEIEADYRKAVDEADPGQSDEARQTSYVQAAAAARVRATAELSAAITAAASQTAPATGGDDAGADEAVTVTDRARAFAASLPPEGPDRTNLTRQLATASLAVARAGELATALTTAQQQAGHARDDAEDQLADHRSGLEGTGQWQVRRRAVIEAYNATLPERELPPGFGAKVDGRVRFPLGGLGRIVRFGDLPVADTAGIGELAGRALPSAEQAALSAPLAAAVASYIEGNGRHMFIQSLLDEGGLELQVGEGAARRTVTLVLDLGDLNLARYVQAPDVAGVPAGHARRVFKEFDHKLAASSGHSSGNLRTLAVSGSAQMGFGKLPHAAMEATPSITFVGQSSNSHSHGQSISSLQRFAGRFSGVLAYFDFLGASLRTRVGPARPGRSRLRLRNPPAVPESSGSVPFVARGSFPQELAPAKLPGDPPGVFRPEPRTLPGRRKLGISPEAVTAGKAKSERLSRARLSEAPGAAQLPDEAASAEEIAAQVAAVLPHVFALAESAAGLDAVRAGVLRALSRGGSLDPKIREGVELFLNEPAFLRLFNNIAGSGAVSQPIFDSEGNEAAYLFVRAELRTAQASTNDQLGLQSNDLRVIGLSERHSQGGRAKVSIGQDFGHNFSAPGSKKHLQASIGGGFEFTHRLISSRNEGGTTSSGEFRSTIYGGATTRYLTQMHLSVEIITPQARFGGIPKVEGGLLVPIHIPEVQADQFEYLLEEAAQGRLDAALQEHVAAVRAGKPTVMPPADESGGTAPRRYPPAALAAGHGIGASVVSQLAGAERVLPALKELIKDASSGKPWAADWTPFELASVQAQLSARFSKEGLVKHASQLFSRDGLRMQLYRPARWGVEVLTVTVAATHGAEPTGSGLVRTAALALGPETVTEHSGGDEVAKVFSTSAHLSAKVAVQSRGKRQRTFGAGASGGWTYDAGDRIDMAASSLITRGLSYGGMVRTFDFHDVNFHLDVTSAQEKNISPGFLHFVLKQTKKKAKQSLAWLLRRPAAPGEAITRTRDIPGAVRLMMPESLTRTAPASEAELREVGEVGEQDTVQGGMGKWPANWTTQANLPSVTPMLDSDGHVALNAGDLITEALGSEEVRRTLQDLLRRVGIRPATAGDMPWTISASDSLTSAMMRGPSVIMHTVVQDGYFTDRSAVIMLEGYPTGARLVSESPVKLSQAIYSEEESGVTASKSVSKTGGFQITLPWILGRMGATWTPSVSYGHSWVTNKTSVAGTSSVIGHDSEVGGQYLEYSADMVWRITVTARDKNMLSTVGRRFGPGDSAGAVSWASSLLKIKRGISYLRPVDPVPDLRFMNVPSGPAPISSGPASGASTDRPDPDGGPPRLIRSRRIRATGGARPRMLPEQPVVPPGALTERLYPPAVNPDAVTEEPQDVTGEGNPLVRMVGGLIRQRAPEFLEANWTIRNGRPEHQVPSKLQKVLDLTSMGTLIDLLRGPGLILDSIRSGPGGNWRLQIVLRGRRDPAGKGMVLLKEAGTGTVVRFMDGSVDTSESRSRTQGGGTRAGDPGATGPTAALPGATLGPQDPSAGVAADGTADALSPGSGQATEKSGSESRRLIDRSSLQIAGLIDRYGVELEVSAKLTRTWIPSRMLNSVTVNIARKMASWVQAARWQRQVPDTDPVLLTEQLLVPRELQQYTSNPEPRPGRDVAIEERHPSDPLPGTKLPVTADDIRNRKVVSLGFEHERLQVLFDEILVRLAGNELPVSGQRTDKVGRLTEHGTRARDALHYLLSYGIFSARLGDLLAGPVTMPRLVREGGPLTDTFGDLSVSVSLVDPQVTGHFNAELEGTSFRQAQFQRSFARTEGMSLDLLSLGGDLNSGDRKASAVSAKGQDLNGAVDLSFFKWQTKESAGGLRQLHRVDAIVRDVPWLRVSADAIVTVTMKAWNARWWTGTKRAVTVSFLVRDGVMLAVAPEAALDLGLSYTGGIPVPSGTYFPGPQPAAATSAPGRTVSGAAPDPLEAAFSLPYLSGIFGVQVQTAADGSFLAGDGTTMTAAELAAQIERRMSQLPAGPRPGEPAPAPRGPLRPAPGEPVLLLTPGGAAVPPGNLVSPAEALADELGRPVLTVDSPYVITRDGSAIAVRPTPADDEPGPFGRGWERGHFVAVFPSQGPRRARRAQHPLPYTLTDALAAARSELGWDADAGARALRVTPPKQDVRVGAFSTAQALDQWRKWTIAAQQLFAAASKLLPHAGTASPALRAELDAAARAIWQVPGPQGTGPALVGADWSDLARFRAAAEDLSAVAANIVAAARQQWIDSVSLVTAQAAAAAGLVTVSIPGYGPADEETAARTELDNAVNAFPRPPAARTITPADVLAIARNMDGIAAAADRVTTAVTALLTQLANNQPERTAAAMDLARLARAAAEALLPPPDPGEPAPVAGLDAAQAALSATPDDGSLAALEAEAVSLLTRAWSMDGLRDRVTAVTERTTAARAMLPFTGASQDDLTARLDAATAALAHQLPGWWDAGTAPGSQPVTAEAIAAASAWLAADGAAGLLSAVTAAESLLAEVAAAADTTAEQVAEMIKLTSAQLQHTGPLQAGLQRKLGAIDLDPEPWPHRPTAQEEADAVTSAARERAAREPAIQTATDAAAQALPAASAAWAARRDAALALARQLADEVTPDLSADEFGVLVSGLTAAERALKAVPVPELPPTPQPPDAAQLAAMAVKLTTFSDLVANLEAAAAALTRAAVTEPLEQTTRILAEIIGEVRNLAPYAGPAGQSIELPQVPPLPARADSGAQLTAAGEALAKLRDSVPVVARIAAAAIADGWDARLAEVKVLLAQARQLLEDAGDLLPPPVRQDLAGQLDAAEAGLPAQRPDLEPTAGLAELTAVLSQLATLTAAESAVSAVATRARNAVRNRGSALVRFGQAARVLLPQAGPHQAQLGEALAAAEKAVTGVAALSPRTADQQADLLLMPEPETGDTDGDAPAPTGSRAPSLLAAQRAATPTLPSAPRVPATTSMLTAVQEWITRLAALRTAATNVRDAAVTTIDGLRGQADAVTQLERAARLLLPATGTDRERLTAALDSAARRLASARPPWWDQDDQPDASAVAEWLVLEQQRLTDAIGQLRSAAADIPPLAAGRQAITDAIMTAAEQARAALPYTGPAEAELTGLLTAATERVTEVADASSGSSEGTSAGDALAALQAMGGYSDLAEVSLQVLRAAGEELRQRLDTLVTSAGWALSLLSVIGPAAAGVMGALAAALRSARELARALGAADSPAAPASAVALADLVSAAAAAVPRLDAAVTGAFGAAAEAVAERGQAIEQLAADAFAALSRSAKPKPEDLAAFRAAADLAADLAVSAEISPSRLQAAAAAALAALLLFKDLTIALADVRGGRPDADRTLATAVAALRGDAAGPAGTPEPGTDGGGSGTASGQPSVGQGKAARLREVPVQQADLLTSEAEAIVNFAEGSLLAVTGLSGQILAAGGAAMREELAEYQLTHGRPGPADAVITLSQSDAQPHVIHILLPRLAELPEQERQNIVRTAYQTALAEGDMLGVRSLAVPLIPPGLRGVVPGHQDIAQDVLQGTRARIGSISLIDHVPSGATALTQAASEPGRDIASAAARLNAERHQRADWRASRAARREQAMAAVRRSLHVERIPTSPDGNCFYHAIIEMFGDDPRVRAAATEGHLALRQRRRPPRPGGPTNAERLAASREPVTVIALRAQLAEVVRADFELANQAFEQGTESAARWAHLFPGAITGTLRERLNAQSYALHFITTDGAWQGDGLSEWRKLSGLSSAVPGAPVTGEIAVGDVIAQVAAQAWGLRLTLVGYEQLTDIGDEGEREAYILYDGAHYEGARTVAGQPVRPASQLRDEAWALADAQEGPPPAPASVDPAQLAAERDVYAAAIDLLVATLAELSEAFDLRPADMAAAEAIINRFFDRGTARLTQEAVDGLGVEYELLTMLISRIEHQIEAGKVRPSAE